MRERAAESLHDSRVPSKRELRDTAEALRRILKAVERPELTAPPGLVTRLEGAGAALEALGGDGSGSASREGESAQPIGNGDPRRSERSRCGNP